MEKLKVQIKQTTQTTVEKEIKIPYFAFDGDFKYAKISGPTNVVHISLNKAFSSVTDIYQITDVLQWETVKEISEAEYEAALEEAVMRLTNKK